MVESDEALAELVAALEASPVISIDTESNSMYAHRERVCLIQFSTFGHDWIVDPLAVKDLSSLGPVLADPNKPTVLHGADYDVRCLRRDYGFQIRGLFDTLIAAQMLGFEKIGLADLLIRFFGVEVDKKFQRHDWGRRPLLPEHLEYARGDTHFLLALREIMNRMLDKAGRRAHAEEEARIMEDLESNDRPFDPNDAFTMKGLPAMKPDELRVLRQLFIFREKKAADLDRPTFKVIPNQTLIELAKKQPANDQELGRIFNGRSNIRRRWGEELLDAIDDGLDDDSDLPELKKKRSKPAPKRRGPKARLTGKAADEASEALKTWRNRLVSKDSDYTSHNVISNGILKRIASVRPYTLEELAAIPEVRNWQVEEFGERLLAILEKVDPRS